MQRIPKQVWLGIAFMFLSALTYFIHFLIFRDPHHIFIYMVGDIAFVFIEVLMVTLIIHALLEHRERRTRLEKLNMVIGIFFSEMGTELVSYFSDLDPNLETLRGELTVSSHWKDAEFREVTRHLAAYAYRVEPERLDLVKVKDYLVSKRDFLLMLLENPNLIEHERFTNLLWAVFHAAEELRFRKDLSALPQEDIAHLTGDINRAYGLLVSEWIAYMKHLRENFPYLFSLAIRTNPFDENASVIVKQA
ncbi:MAG TPA: hypothetical protein ENN34_03590 [Deltaproteobacteria bacterium]|nr:hypothetical protein [Deltaproteobacteria bacterium]